MLNRFLHKVRTILGTGDLSAMYHEVKNLRVDASHMLADQYLRQNLFTNPHYLNSKKITHFHRSVYTQNGEDGIIEEIFKRVKTTNQYFVEFGVHGVKNNSTYLLLKNWKGLWLGTGDGVEENIVQEFRQPIASGALAYQSVWLTAENVQEVFEHQKVPREFDFLSIDIDGNDYWIWKAIDAYSPRVVCIEYNATFPPTCKWIMEYNPLHRWNQNSYFGASLKALEDLAKQKGYSLVGCDFTGCNAFFVRDDLDLNRFETPFTAEHHYEPPRYFLGLPTGHAQGFGPYVTEL